MTEKEGQLSRTSSAGGQDWRVPLTQSTAGSSSGSTELQTISQIRESRPALEKFPSVSKEKQLVVEEVITQPPIRRGMACTFCRRRKLRCSGTRPQCSCCIKYKQDCVYSSEQKRAVLKDPQNDMKRKEPISPSLQPDPPETQDYGQVDYFDGGFVDYSEGQAYYPLSEPVPDHTQLSIYSEPISEQSSDSVRDYSTPFDQVALPQDQVYASQSLYTPLVPAQIPLPSDDIFTNPYSDIPFESPSYPNFSVLGPAMISPPEAQGWDAWHPSAHTAPQLKTYQPSNHTYTMQMAPPPLPDPPMPASASGPRLYSQPVLSSTTTPGISGPVAQISAIYPAQHDTDPVDALTDRLGEFLLSPVVAVKESKKKSSKMRKRDEEAALVRGSTEYDGLVDATRNSLIDTFLAHSRLFFEISVPRFRYRMSLNDKRRPSPALLNAMYLWATRISASAQTASMEQHFFSVASKHLNTSSASGDRLVDAVRAAMLLASYSHVSGKHQEGWAFAGQAIRMILAAGLHHITSCVFTATPPANNEFLRQRIYSLPPPEDALELAERIHAFWCVFAIDRCSAVGTGFVHGIKDEDITTPFPRSIADIASGKVTHQDDITVRDLYRPSYMNPEGDSPYIRWLKSLALAERSAKLAFAEAEPLSEYSIAWNNYRSAPVTAPPPSWLDQPKYKTPKAFEEIKFGLHQVLASLGEDGIFPVDRVQNAELNGIVPPTIASHTLLIHRLLSAVQMFIYDVNAVDVTNIEALMGARKCLQLMTSLEPMPIADIDGFLVLVWGIVTKTFIKEVHRCYIVGDIAGAHTVEAEVDLMIEEISRVGATMHQARIQVAALKDLKQAAAVRGSMHSQPTDYFASTSTHY